MGLYVHRTTLCFALAVVWLQDFVGRVSGIFTPQTLRSAGCWWRWLTQNCAPVNFLR